jgi:(S)-sulfolactate dehydrogenase
MATTKNKIVISEFMDEDAVALLDAEFDVRYEPTLVDSPTALADAVGAAQALIVRNRTQVRGEVLGAARNLKVVGRLGVGLDNIDVDACEARGIVVIPATGANALAVAEYVVATAMMLLRGAYHSTAAVAAGAWPRNQLGLGREAGGRTLGLVGFGSIGQLTAGKAAAIGMRVIAHDALVDDDSLVWAVSGIRGTSLANLLQASDVVSLHMPLTPETRGFFSREVMQAMKPGAILINTARGGIVDELALAELLASGHLGGAAIDVFANEPLAADSPLATAPNIILTPHIAGLTVEANGRVSDLIARRVAESLRGPLRRKA